MDKKPYESHTDLNKFMELLALCVMATLYVAETHTTNVNQYKLIELIQTLFVLYIVYQFIGNNISVNNQFEM